MYKFPESELGHEDRWMRSRLPFAVVGSDSVRQGQDGRLVRGREYPWGIVDIEDQVNTK